MRLHLLVTAPLLAGLVGCAGLGQPPVTPAVVAHAKATSPAATAASLEHGREIYLQKCGACHELKDVDEESRAGWPARMSDMAKRAKLTPAEEADALAYVLAARP